MRGGFTEDLGFDVDTVVTDTLRIRGSKQRDTVLSWSPVVALARRPRGEAINSQSRQ